MQQRLQWAPYFCGAVQAVGDVSVSHVALAVRDGKSWKCLDQVIITKCIAAST